MLYILFHSQNLLHDMFLKEKKTENGKCRIRSQDIHFPERANFYSLKYLTPASKIGWNLFP